MNLSKINEISIDLISSISKEAIVRFYFGEFQIKKKYKSPLRDDKSPSFNWYYSKNNNNLYCKDLSTGEILDPINFVMRLYNLNYYGAIRKIAIDFGILNSIGIQYSKLKPILEYKPEIDESETSIKFIYGKFTNLDLEYWKQWEGSEERLKKFNIYSVQKVWIDGYSVKFEPNELRYIFYNPKTDKSKLYRPFASKTDKWRNNCSGLKDILGYYQADIKNTNPKLILTKAMKEIVLYDAYDIKAISHHSENGFFIPDFIRHLKKYCETITTIYDNDASGIKGMQKVQELYQIPYIIPPEEKNITDWYTINKEKTIKFINTLKDG